MFEREFRELSFVPRFVVGRCLRTQSVAEHSYYVMLYSMQVAQLVGRNDLTGNVAKLAAMHDVSETATGDLPSPVKKALQKRAGGVMDGIEEDYMSSRFPDTVDWMDEGIEARAIVRVADALDAVLWCCTEEQMGNMSLGGGIMSQDLVNVRGGKVDATGTQGIGQVVLVQLAKAWFNLAMIGMITEDNAMILWRGIFEKTILHHRFGQSDIFSVVKDA